MTPERANVLGVGFDPVDMDGAIAKIRSALVDRAKGYICLGGVHGVMEVQKDPTLRPVFANALMVAPDGMPIVWIGRLKGFEDIRRVFGPDLMIEVMTRPELKDCTHFLCGGGNGVAEDLRAQLILRFPQINILGTYTPPFRTMNEDEEIEMTDIIRRLQPDVIWVGLSTPKQERFMSRYLPKLDTTLMIGVGAAFLFHTGKIRDSPVWVKQAGLQWLDRLIQEPLRLWKRYLLGNSKFLISIALQMTGLRKYPMQTKCGSAAEHPSPSTEKL